MIIVNGVMEYCMQNAGSKSEGKMALLKCDDGKEYFLYRSGEHPVNDVFFTPFDGKRIEVEGKAEERTGYFCVTSIREEIIDQESEKQ